MDAGRKGFVTPIEEVFQIAHFGQPSRPAPADWSLAVAGRVRRPLRLTLAALRDMPSATVTAFHECFGNPLEPDVPTRRVANLVWTGVPLAAVLEAAGPLPGAAHVWFGGFDRTWSGGGPLDYLKDLPLAEAAERVLLAYAVNGEPLPHPHGGPLRSVALGMFATNSVKWLERLTVSDDRPDHVFTTRLYHRNGVPVRLVDVNSVLTSPVAGRPVRPGPVVLAGWAWSDTEVVQVELSIDDGPWQDAEVQARGSEPTWQGFALTWQATSGRHVVRCRARDAAGRVQPDLPARNEIQTVVLTVS